MKIEELYSLYTQNYLVDTDTRNIRKNTIFFALKGGNFNGNKFAEEALEKGALYAVVDEEEFSNNEHIILVDDVLVTLQKLANYHRKELKKPIIALTGSNGKTTTKELINSVLSQKFNTLATKGNLNNHIGVPITLLSMKPEHEIGIIEMGANHHKEIAFLCSITEPDYGYITNFGKAHLEGFGSVEGVIEAKSEMYHFLLKNQRKIFVNQSDKIQVEKTEKGNTIFFDDSIEYVGVNPFVELKYKDQRIVSNLIGKYNFSNIAAAITIGEYFNVSSEGIVKAIETYVPTNNRSQIIKIGNNEIILDAYNANPTSMKAALENFNDIKAADKIVVLGDMFELGDDSLKEHQSISDLCESLNFDKVILVGENFNKVETNINQKFSSFDDLINNVNSLDLNKAHILIKGSRGMALERLVDLIS
ncbi:UDP-N-acetylmuramoyl-tripeptide--D-alanyl-D-alanine ligase [Tenacibaculum holothuriorum]|uniref:UDP-N-acetylmuramoyl-tripeptide--D-alanyl-D-alanine ligase n=1 Tax=Tenacibaculum holothuriorum TaxID=1635173 RepID=A0A1Y2PCD2_9FLAO|nr:UDP-N-acetylmuramoyl-tripeptide--D-alanyl-D-alanine ligase [Tenacibaculum holothuriorum]OSY88133.1 UDP-N-acetylmuramoyl-tripeptide--D-alanyl-D-alanine ligase [Tenacibaculum holothuriorum]